MQVAQGGSIWDNGQTLVMLSNGSLWAWGNDRAAQLGDGATAMEPLPVRFHAPAGVVYRSLATGSATSYAISTTGKVYAWGVAHVGQVGDGHTRTAVTAVVVATGAALDLGDREQSGHQPFAEDVTSDGEHFLHGLAGHPELAGDLGLRDALIGQAANQVAALPGQILGDAEVLEGFGADFFEAPDGVLLGGSTF